MNFHNRLKKMEDAVLSQPCPACAILPRVVLIDGDADRERWEKTQAGHERECTCERPRSVKLVVLERAT